MDVMLHLLAGSNLEACQCLGTVKRKALVPHISTCLLVDLGYLSASLQSWCPLIQQRVV